MSKDKTITLVPRLRGRIIQEGKHWTWEAWVTIGDDDIENGVYLKSDKQFLNFVAAENNLKETAPEILKTSCQAIGGTIPEDFIDLKRGIVVREDEFKKPKRFV
jgi:hypothetical protein